MKNDKIETGDKAIYKGDKSVIFNVGKIGVITANCQYFNGRDGKDKSIDLPIADLTLFRKG
ncbi:hypothetical protein [uncultured Mucilaginibacter sp.]|uniref:hypothetical protein n=1 Tax=uncultured Mucilaginibacter sp. TaxID=797541 RepID=UPI0025FF5A8E|nr:hypothetical protein [uncultured Mucilaginibacter sp.]